MSNKTRLQTNNTNIQSLIDKANSLPDAGSGGGGNIETCNIIFEAPTGVFYYDFKYACTVYNDNAIASNITGSMIEIASKTVNNVICGTAFTIRYQYVENALPEFSWEYYNLPVDIQEYNDGYVTLEFTTPSTTGDYTIKFN